MGKFLCKKMTLQTIIISLFFLISFPARQNLFAIPFAMISAGNPILDDIRLLVRESGSSFLSFTPPLSRDEILLILDDIDGESLPPPLRELYDKVYGALSPALLYSEGLFGLEAHVNFAPEIHFRTNADIPFSKPDTSSPITLALPLTMYFANTVELTITPSLSGDPLYYGEGGSHWGTNVPYEANRFDMNMPLRAFIAAGGAWWNFQLGREKVSYGLGHTGNLALSATPDYYDFARLSLFSRSFKYSAFVSQMPLNLEDPQILSDSRKTAAGPDALLDTTQRYLYHHRIDARFFHKVSLGLSEALMVGNSSPELRYLSPLIVFHNAWPWRDYDEWGSGEKGYMTGSLFSIDLDWAIIPSLAVYGQFVLNEFSTPYELENYPDDQPPNGLGYLAGIEYTPAFNQWGALFYGEFVYTDPYLYTLSSPFASFYWMRRPSELTSTSYRYAWTGHPEGRDTMLFSLGALAYKENLSLSSELSFIRKGEHTLYWDWGMGSAYNDQHTPSGTAENKVIASIGAGFKPLSSVMLKAQISGILVFDAGHIQGEQETGAEVILSASYTY
jgi:hypothetical protein